MKKICKILTMFLFISISNVYAINTSEPYINPKWIKYMSLSEEEKSKWEVTPEQYIVDFVYEKSYNDIFSKDFSNTTFNNYNDIIDLPSTYDLRNVNGITTQSRDQKTAGLCWAFATVAAAESNLLVHSENLKSDDTINTINLSERQLDYATVLPTLHIPYNSNTSIFAINEKYNPYSRDRKLADGGNFNTIRTIISNGLALVSDTENSSWGTYTDMSDTLPLNKIFNSTSIDYSITETKNFPYLDVFDNAVTESAKSSWRSEIKKHIINDGALYVGTRSPGRACSVVGAININGDPNSNKYWLIFSRKSVLDCGETTTAQENAGHAMTIIGWNDNLTYSYCNDGSKNKTLHSTKTSCEISGYNWISGTGAWLLKNSWGEGLDNMEFLYLAYDSLIDSVNGVTSVVKKDWDNNYNAVLNKSEKKYDSTNIAIETVFHKIKNNNENLIRVTFYSQVANKTYAVYVKPSSQETYTFIGNVTAELPGFVSIDASNILLNDESFTIKIANNLNISEISAFTTNAQTPQILSEVKVDNQESGVTAFDQYTVALNLNSGAKISYDIYNSSGQLSNSYFSVDDAYIINKKAKGKINVINTNYTPGTYTIKAKYNGNVIASNTFYISSPTITLQTPIITNTINSEAKLYNGYSGSVKLGVTAQDISGALTVAIKKDTTNVTSNFTITGTAVSNNSANINITIPPTTSVGTYTITVTKDAISKTETFIVYAPTKVTGITPTNNSITLSKGATSQIETTIQPTTATDKGLTYTSSDTTVATVSSTGLITGMKKGTTTITVAAKDGSNVKTTINVTVNDSFFNSGGYTVDGEYIYLPDQLTINTFLSKVSTTRGQISLNTITGNYVGTGNTIKVVDNNTDIMNLKIIVAGDVDGDGQVDVTDLTIIRKHILQINIIRGDIYIKAGDVDDDSQVDVTDLTIIRKHILQID